ncbi:MAG: AgmX/PglI C-terminal domain-containing protein, partial [Myxococcota bacterium]|nr:AgmX/PglI C-terminal domain-containing protein [Myxococcota bacterium]
MRSRPSHRPLALAAWALVCTALLTWAGDGQAHMHPRQGMPQVGQVAQEAIILHHDGEQELILRVDYVSEGVETLATIALGEGKVKGGCDADAVREIIEKRMPPMRYCYVKGMKRNASLAGDLTLRWTITADGRVEQAAVTADSVGDDALSDCVQKNVRRWRFPRSPDDSCVVEWPMTFRKKGSEVAREDERAKEAIAWIIPVPRAPMEYATRGFKMFTELDEWAELRRASPAAGSKDAAKKGAADGSEASGVSLLKPALVGPFRV